jgi:hypothetical protein
MFTKISVRNFTVLILLASTNFGRCDDDPKLPAETTQLIKRFDLWEAVQREELEKTVRAKTVELIATLKRQLDATTKQGNLDGALAIRKRIAELETRHLPTSASQLEAWLEGRKIVFNGKSGKHVVEIFEHGKAILHHGKKSGQKASYRVLSDRVVELKWGGKFRLEYSRDMSKATLIAPSGNYPDTTTKS